MGLKEKLQALLDQAVRGLQAGDRLPADLAVAAELERPANPAHGDYATNLALKLAKAARRNPRDLAGLLAAELRTHAEVFSGVEVAGPGFVNLKLHARVLLEEVDAARAAGERYGDADWARGRKILLEYVSANPTGPLNVVSARAAAVGDTLARILRSQGAEVFKEYYINDAGRQARLLGESAYARWKESQGEVVAFPDQRGEYSSPALFRFPVDGYHGEYVREIAAATATAHQAELATATTEQAIEIHRENAIRDMVDSHRSDLGAFGVEFEAWFYESSLHQQGKVEAAIQDLKAHGYIFEQEGAVWFRSTAFGDDKDRVLIKADGTYAYLAADIAYHRDKFARGFTELIDLWGPDHHGYIARMRAAMQALGHAPESFQVHIVQQVNLLEHGRPVAMSKRAGRFITMKDLVDDVGRDVARFFFLMRGTDAHLDFDLDLARRHTEENPVFYVQYAHARICSIIRKAAEEGQAVPGPGSAAVFDGERAPEELELTRNLAAFPEALEVCARTLEPHGLTFYLRELATVFHRFYTVCRVLDPEAPDRSRARLALVDATRVVLHNGLTLLGIAAPESM